MSVKSAGPDASSTPASTLSTRQWDQLVGLLLAAVTLGVYLRTMARDVLPGDPGEFQFAAWRFGLAHATGYPLYMIAGGLWQRLLAIFGVSPALALNLLSALTGTAAVVLLYSTLRRWLPGTPALRRAAALVAAVFLAANPTFWSQALIAEVYTLHALFLVLILDAFRRIDQSEGGASPVWLGLVVGLSLSHHATTLLLLPGLAAGLWLLRAKLSRFRGAWLAALALAVAPLLLYLYVPLRATPAASPWYFPQLGSETLALYSGGWRGFRDFVTGRSISVGFYGAGDALSGFGQAWRLWRLHFGWPGLALIVVGLYVLWSEKRRALLALTVISALAFQLFNLFYAIEDILVYYIPLYVIGCLWLGYGAAQFGRGFMQMAEAVNAEPAAAGGPGATRAPINWEVLGVGLTLILLYFPLRTTLAYGAGLDQSGAGNARALWESVLAANPPQGAILVSNDRNEIVPLYYMQQVEGRRADLTGLFPLIAPEARFADVGATLDTALASGAPVALIKPMPGLEARFALEAAAPPLVRATGPSVPRGSSPQHPVEQPHGPLTLLGFDWVPQPEGVRVAIYWQVDAGVPGAQTTTVQLFDEAGGKVAQSDAAPGGVYYPTSLWKPGETLVEQHTLVIPDGPMPATLLVGMYAGPEMAALAPPLSIDLSGFNLSR